MLDLVKFKRDEMTVLSFVRDCKLLLSLIARQMLSVVTSYLINICHQSRGGGSQLNIIPPYGVNYEMFPAPAQFLFIYNCET